MIDHLSLEIEHGTDVVPTVQLDRAVRAGQTVVALDATERAVEGHLSCPGEDGGLAAMRTIQAELLRRRS